MRQTTSSPSSALGHPTAEPSAHHSPRRLGLRRSAVFAVVALMAGGAVLIPAGAASAMPCNFLVSPCHTPGLPPSSFPDRPVLDPGPRYDDACFPRLATRHVCQEWVEKQ